MSNDRTPALSLPYLLPGQAQKHVTLNETLSRLDAIVQLSVISASLTEAPPSPDTGARYLLTSAASGANWSEFAAQSICRFDDGAWQAITPHPGWIVYVEDVGDTRIFDGTVWAPLTDTSQYLIRSGDGWNEDAAVSVSASPVGFPATSYRRTNDAGRSLVFGFDGANRRLFINRWNPADDSYIENLMFIGQDGSVDFVGAAPPTANGADMFHAGASAIPSADDTIDLGSASHRFSQMFAQSGTISTSDAREKTSFAAPSDGLKRATQRIIGEVGVFQWQSAVTAKGASSARQHIGLPAQRVRDILIEEGEDPSRYGLFCRDDWTDTETGAPAHRLGLRLDQFILMALVVMFEMLREREKLD